MSGKKETPVAAEAKDQIRFLGKMNTKEIIGLDMKGIRALFVGGVTGAEITLYEVFGTIAGTKTGTKQFGDEVRQFTGFRGKFEGKCMLENVPNTGVVFRSAMCYLPGVITDMLAVDINSALKIDPTAVGRFHFRIGVIESDSATGYQFTVNEVRAFEQHDALEDMRQDQALLEAVDAETGEVSDGAVHFNSEKTKETTNA